MLQYTVEIWTIGCLFEWSILCPSAMLWLFDVFKIILTTDEFCCRAKLDNGVRRIKLFYVGGKQVRENVDLSWKLSTTGFSTQGSRGNLVNQFEWDLYPFILLPAQHESVSFWNCKTAVLRPDPKQTGSTASLPQYSSRGRKYSEDIRVFICSLCFILHSITGLDLKLSILMLLIWY